MIFSLVSLLAASVLAGEHLYLKAPLDKKGDPALLIFLQGAQISNTRYVELAEKIQKQAQFPLNVLLPEFYFDVAIPVQQYVSYTINDAKKKFNIDPTIPTFVAGHSIGASAAMGEAFADPSKYSGTIIMGASIARKYNTTFPTPILQLNGEMDGLQRVSRVTEAIFNHYDRQSNLITPQTIGKKAIVMIRGMNHLQFADGLNPPLVVKNLDLLPDIETAEAHDQVSALVSHFLCIHHSSGTCALAASAQTLAVKVQQTRVFVDPMIQAFEMEGSPHLYHSCNSDRPAAHCPFYPAWPLQESRPPSTDKDCICGTPFAAKAAVIMSGLDQSKYPVFSLDSIHDVSDTKPFHHAHIWNNCTLTKTFPCMVNHTTVSEQMYEKDANDTGFPSATAYELRIKMKSRQVFQLSTINTTASLDDTDKDSICRDINMFSYKWALETASDEARERFEKYGQKIEFLEDSLPILPIGPLFINSKLRIKEGKNKEGKSVLQVQAIGFKTPQSGFVTTLYPDSNGYHYCKVLSPARAMEHIYTDGLRKYKGYRS